MPKKYIIVTGDLEKLIGGRINCPQTKDDNFDHLNLGVVKMLHLGIDHIRRHDRDYVHGHILKYDNVHGRISRFHRHGHWHIHGY